MGRLLDRWRDRVGKVSRFKGKIVGGLDKVTKGLAAGAIITGAAGLELSKRGDKKVGGILQKVGETLGKGSRVSEAVGEIAGKETVADVLGSVSEALRDTKYSKVGSVAGKLGILAEKGGDVLSSISSTLGTGGFKCIHGGRICADKSPHVHTNYPYGGSMDANLPIAPEVGHSNGGSVISESNPLLNYTRPNIPTAVPSY